MSLERSVGPRLVVALSAACPVAEAKSSLRDATCAKSQGTARQPAGAKSQGLKPVLSGEAQRAHSSHTCVMCVHASHVHVAHRGRQTHSKSAVPSRAALAHFSLALWLPGRRTSLALAVPRQARQKPGVCSAGPRQSCILASIFCHSFPKAQHCGRTREAVSGYHFPAVPQSPSRRGVTSQRVLR